tara:strand:+ start:3019 stop:3555 length:537 start_codon:yes stop_codon:yes gene_type:complete
MCTTTLTALKAGCKDISGISKLYFIDKAARIAAGIAYTIVDGDITIVGTDGAAFEVIPKQNSFSVTNPTNASADNNSLFYLQTISGMVHGNSSAQKALIQNINKGVTEVLVEYTNGTHEFFGTDVSGMQADGGDGQASGQAAGDAKGATLSLTGQSSYIAPNLADITSFKSAFTVTEA